MHTVLNLFDELKKKKLNLVPLVLHVRVDEREDARGRTDGRNDDSQPVSASPLPPVSSLSCTVLRCALWSLCCAVKGDHCLTCTDAHRTALDRLKNIS